MKTIYERWEQGINHDPRSIEIYKALVRLDTLDSFCWKSGGDGDNGAFLMYCLDVYFEEKDLDIKLL